MTEATPSKVEVSVVIPVFRTSEAILAELCRRVRDTLLASGHADCEIILVDDSGEIRQWAAIKSIQSRLPGCRGLRLGRNYGQHNALLAGIRAARGDIVVTMDDDLQNPPEEIPRLLSALSPEIDVVYGLPATRAHASWRNWGAAALKAILATAMGQKTAAMVSPFRAFRLDLRQGFDGYNGPDVMIDVLLNWSTSRFTAVTVAHHARREGSSGYSLRRLLRLAATLVVGFSALPLRLSSIAGFVMAAFGFVLLVFVVGRYFLSNVHVPGFTFLASLIAIFSGVQMVALGIVGEYLARMHFRSQGRPSYFIRERTPDDRDLSS